MIHRKKKIKKSIKIKYSKENKEFYNLLCNNKKKIIKKFELQIHKLNNSEIPIRFKILALPISFKEKSVLINKYESLEKTDPSSPEYFKYISYFNTIIQIPFGKYHNLNIINSINFLKKSQSILDSVIYGNFEAKNHILQILSIYISNPKSSPNIFGLTGPMGVGKTTLIKEGLSKCMDNRPFEFISLGGLCDSSYFDGHSFTYEGARYGKFVEILLKYKIMNPIIYFDELDKVSNTEKGNEIIDLLIHITDPTQNSKFVDKYFSDIYIDLSKCIFVFSYNNRETVNSILRDRIFEINIEDYSIKEKVIITNKFILPSLIKEIGIDTTKFKFEHNKIIEHIIITYACNSVGMRYIKKILFQILSKINLLIISHFNFNLLHIKQQMQQKFPIIINKKILGILITTI